MFLAEHTVQDIRDLAKAKDAEIARIQAARDAFVGPLSDPLWDGQWHALRRAYDAAKKTALSGIVSIPFLDDSMHLADNRYRTFVSVLAPLFDLYSRLAAATGKSLTMTLPQPAADPDSEFLHTTRAAAELGHALRAESTETEKSVKNWLGSPWVKLGLELGLLTLAATAMDKLFD